jgi:hypothetical protein
MMNRPGGRERESNRSPSQEASTEQQLEAFVVIETKHGAAMLED